LVDVFTGNATVTISGSGITWTIASAVASSVAINYSVSASAATGDRTVTVSDRFGSSQAALNVGDGTPHVTGINPDSWQAGQTTTVVFTGYNFGTAPKLSFSSSQVTATITSANNTQITASVSVAAASPYQIVKVTVTSTGYNGSGFISTNGNPPSTQDTATILPIPAPVPKILRNGSNITGTTGIAVVTGQQVYLTTQITAPLTPTSFSWSVGGTNIGGYSIATGTHPATGNIVQTALNQATVKFYWVYAGQGLTVTFRYCMENAECSPNVQATFNVSGVTNAAFGATTPTSDVKINTFTDNCVGDLYYGQTVKWMSLGQLTAEGGTYPNCGFTIPSPGIKFTASGTMPGSGGWKFVQILLTNSETITTTTHAAQTSSCGTGLDNFYPYPFTYLSTNSAQDSPGELISPAPSGTTYTEFNRSFTAKMFSMWQSSTANSIPVPIGYHQWYTIQDGLRSSSGTWSLASDTNWSSGTFVAAAASQSAKGYPTWSTVSINGPCTSYNVATMN